MVTIMGHELNGDVVLALGLATMCFGLAGVVLVRLLQLDRRERTREEAYRTEILERRLRYGGTGE